MGSKNITLYAVGTGADGTRGMSSSTKRPRSGFLKLDDNVAIIVLPRGGQVEDITSVCIAASTIPPVLFAALNAHMARCTGYDEEPDGSRRMILDKELHLLSWDLREEIVSEALKSDDILDSEVTDEDLGDDACTFLVKECKRLFHGKTPEVVELAIVRSFRAPSLTIRVEVPAL